MRNQYVITKADKILYRITDFEDDATVTNITNLLSSCRVNYKHSEENPVCLEYWLSGEAVNSRTLSPSYMRH